MSTLALTELEKKDVQALLETIQEKNAREVNEFADKFLISEAPAW